MPSAKLTFKEQDRSAVVQVTSELYAGIVITSRKGDVNTPKLISSPSELISKFGKPDPKLGTQIYSAIIMLGQGNKLWVTRAAHQDATHSAALVRSKVSPVSPKDTTLSDDSLEVLPLKRGLTYDQLRSYNFPIYATKRTFTEVKNQFKPVQGFEPRVPITPEFNLRVGDSITVTNGDTPVADTDLVSTIQEIVSEESRSDVVTFDTDVKATAGSRYYRAFVDGNNNTINALVEYTGRVPTVTESNNGTRDVVTGNADRLAEGDFVYFGETKITDDGKRMPKDANVKALRVVDKYQRRVEERYAILSIAQFFGDAPKVQLMLHGDTEQRDSFLVYSVNPSVEGNEVSISVTDSKNYPEAFVISVYNAGLEMETWEVTMDHQVDGFNRQMFLEDKINGSSSYIKVKVNKDNVVRPLTNASAYWMKTPEEVFNNTGVLLKETLLAGHHEVRVSDNASLKVGNRIKFALSEGKLSAEYKVAETSGNDTIVLDRGLVEDVIRPAANGSITTICMFDPNLTDNNRSIQNGIRRYTVKKLDRPVVGYAIGANYTISGETGSLLSSGTNLLGGGSIGSQPTVGDMITALKAMTNKASTPINLLLDGGVSEPAYAAAISGLTNTQGITHAYLSSPLACEEKEEAVDAILKYKNEINGTGHMSMFSGWIKYFDEYNQRYVWISPESFAAASQVFTTRNYQIFYPAAGWDRSSTTGALDVRYHFSETDMDRLVDARINPIHKDGGNIAIWGNETMLSKPGPLQLRSVAMLLIKIKAGIESMLKYKTFDLNNERTYALMEGSINAFMRDEIKAKGGVYDYKLAISSIVTPSDKDNRRVPVYLGIQPTYDIQEIPVTIGIFNSSATITVG